MGVIQEGEEQADGDGLDVVPLDEVDRVIHVLQAQGLHDGALSVHALGHFQTVVPRDEHGGGVLEKVVEGGPG